MQGGVVIAVRSESRVRRDALVTGRPEAVRGFFQYG